MDGEKEERKEKKREERKGKRILEYENLFRGRRKGRREEREREINSRQP